MIITRLFYIYEEVEYSFITELLKKEDIKKTYFWFFELYYSGFKKTCIQLLYKIYYTFYRIKNEKFETFINKKCEKFIETNDIKYIADIIYNLFKMDSCSTVFEIINKLDALEVESDDESRNKKYRITYKTINTLTKYIMNGKHLLFVKKFSKLRYNKNQIFKRLEEMYPELYNAKQCKIVLDKTLLENTQLLESNIISTLYIIGESNYKENNVNHLFKRTFYYRSIPKDIEFIQQIQKNNKDPLMRLYKINEDIGCFLNHRFQDEAYYFQRFIMYWEYYAYLSPLWKSRFDKYKTTINHEQRTIHFKNSDLLEHFYKRYNFDLEDAPYDVYSKSIFPMKRNNVKDWLQSIVRK